MTKTTTYSACLLGGAIGDALGAGVEFMSMREIRQRYGEIGVTDYVEFPDGHAEFTDDTQMTLFTAEGLLRANHRTHLKGIGGATETITYLSYLRWLLTQGEIVPHTLDEHIKEQIESGWLINEKILHKLRAPGNTCLSALRSGNMGTTQNHINNSKGCGGIMRMAPVGLMCEHPDTAFTQGCELAAITHGHPTGYLSSGFLAALIQQISEGKKLEQATYMPFSILQDWDQHEETMEAIETAFELYFQEKESGLKTSDLPRIIAKLGKGWIAGEALAISLFCSLLYKDDFKKGVLAAVNHSGDSDSTGAITGNILGLINGLKAIPEDWISRLEASDIVRQIGEDLATGVKGNEYDPDMEWWEKYPGY